MANPSLIPQIHALTAIIPPLQIEAEHLAQSLRLGVHGRRRAGGGENFWQYRPHTPDDSAASIDWRQSARADTLYIRERENEIAQTVYVWADSSGSMHYRSTNHLPLKTERAHVLMLALAYALLRGGERVSWLGDNAIASQGTNGFNALASRILPVMQTNDNVPKPQALGRNAQVLLCGDFLTDYEAWQERLNHYAALHLRGLLVHIADPIEANPTFTGRVRMEGCEKETPLLLPQAEAVRDAYQQRWAEHKDRLTRMAKNAGWIYAHHITDETPQNALLRLYNLL